MVAVHDGGWIYTSSNFGVSWSARDNVRSWTSIASSADGAKLVATVRDGQIYTSNNSGASWSARDAIRLWRAVASSSDGSRLIAVSYLGIAYISTNSGQSWVMALAIPEGSSATSSADGTRFVVAASDGLHTTSVLSKTSGAQKPSTPSSQGKLVVKKISTTQYWITLTSSAATRPFQITAILKNKMTYEYSGTTTSQGGAKNTANANLSGYAFKLKIG